MRRQDKPQREQKKPPKDKAPPKPSPTKDKEKLRADIRQAFRAAFGYEDKSDPI